MPAEEHVSTHGPPSNGSRPAGPPVPAHDQCLHSDGWILVRQLLEDIRQLYQEVARQGERQLAGNATQAAILDRVDKMTSIVYGGNGHTMDSVLIRLSTLEKHRADQETGAGAKRSLGIAVVAAIVSALTSGVILVIVNVGNHLARH